MSRSHASRRRRRRALIAAASLLPAPALAATYDLSNQTLNVATAPYTAADTLNCSNVTFNSTPAGGALLAAVNLAANDTVNTAGGLTLAGALSGSAALTKSGTGTLTLSALSPSFTGPLTLNPSGGTLRLGIESPLAGTGGTLTLGSSTTLDLNGFNSPGRPVTASGGISIVNNNTTATSTVSSLPSVGFASSVSFGGAGTLNLTANLQSWTGYTKVGTGTLILSSPNPTFNGSITVSAGTLQLGMNAPFSASYSPSISVSSGASLDLNGFSSAGVIAGFASGSYLVNNNTAVTSNITSLPAGATIGGAGDINLTGKVPSLTKADTGTLTLSAANTSFANSLTLNDGTVRLNHTSALGNSPLARFYLNGSSTTGGILDLNGYPAPAGTYNFAGGTLINNNTATPSSLDFSTAKVSTGYGQYAVFGGDGDLNTTGFLPSRFFKVGPGIGALVVNTPQSINATLTSGSLRLAGTGSYYGSLTLYGYNVGYYFDNYGPGALLDAYGNTGSLPSLTLYNNTGIVNNALGTTVTLTGSASVDFNNRNMTFGGNGNLALAPGSLYIYSAITLNKVGAGLLTLPSSISPRGVALRGGTLQAEASNQLGSTVSFLGGALRVAPLYLAPQPSYTFSASLSVDPAGGTIDTQRDTTLTGAFSGTGALTKAGTATLTLSNSPSASIDLSVAAGTLRFAPALAAATVGSLTISPGATVDLRNTTLTTSTSYALLRQYLHDGLLASSTADAAHILGCKDTNPGTYHIQLTLRGDANLDGVINADDYALLDRGYAKSVTSAHWTDGDFNYDGLIDQQDYLLIDTTLGQAQGFSPGFLSQRESRFGPAYVVDLLAAVPEPSAVAYLTGTLLLIGRRRRQ